MSTTSRSTRTPGTSAGAAAVPARAVTALAALAALAVALGLAFVLAPGPVAGSMPGGGYGGRRGLDARLSAYFVDYWRSGERSFPPALRGVVDYWSRYHVVKAVVAAVLLAVLIALGALLWKAFLRGGALTAGSRAALASAGVVVTALALFSLALAVANIQGAVAPFSSLMSMLPVHASHGELADVLDRIRQQLAGYPDAGGATAPPLRVMVSDFGRYHAVVAVAATVVALALAALSALSWRRFAGTAASDRRTRRVLRSAGLLSALSAAAVLVIAAANTATTADPAPALLAFFEGGW
ncbi:hypothetical protein ACFV6Z_09855 [Streptomyces sp. NPDC059818]|uniref:hypothetical protein n=1 Tax=Streptomyces sp. NPDC059818 TaxID=3346962 RepID=UPI003657771D